MFSSTTLLKSPCSRSYRPSSSTLLCTSFDYSGKCFDCLTYSSRCKQKEEYFNPSEDEIPYLSVTTWTHNDYFWIGYTYLNPISVFGYFSKTWFALIINVLIIFYVCSILF